MTMPARSISSMEYEKSDVAFFTGEYAIEVLRAICGRTSIIRSWRVDSLHHRPGAGVSVGYDLMLDVFQSGGGIHRKRTYICVSTARLSVQAREKNSHVTRMELNGHCFYYWEFPFDPELPELQRAVSARFMSEQLGTRAKVHLLSYRPTRRAVVKAEGESAEGKSEVFVKIARPRVAQEILTRMRMIEKSPVPGPQLVFSSPQGLIGTRALPGVSLAHILSQEKEANAHFDVLWDSLLGVLTDLPSELCTLTRRPAWSERVGHYAHAATTVLPTEEKRIARIAQNVEFYMAHSDPGSLVPTHGDFYEANIMVDPQTYHVCGILDIDSAGPGYRVDDIACLFAHMSVLAHLAPQVYPHIGDFIGMWLEKAEKIVDPVALNARCAGVTLSLVAGAKKLQGTAWLADALGRLATAQAWIDRARTWYELSHSSVVPARTYNVNKMQTE